MKTDAIRAALSKMYARYMQSDIGHCDPEALLASLQVIKGLQEFSHCPLEFTDYCQDNLRAGNGDLMSSMLDELWCALGMPDYSTWDAFKDEFLLVDDTP